METKTKKRKVGAPKKRTAPKTEKPRTAGTGSRTSRSLPTRRKKPGPEVVYVPPKPFNRNRLLLSLAITLAVVLALTFSISLFFSVEVITVSGAEKYDAWTVKEASGIQYGDSLLSFGKPKAVGKIKMELPYVNTVRIGIKLPSTVNIYIEEFDVVYAVKERNGSWWLTRSDGVLVEQTDGALASDYTRILGVEITSPEAGQPAVAAETAITPETTTEPVSEEETLVVQPVVVTDAQRLNAAMDILQLLEKNDIIGQVSSVNVSDLGAIQLWYGDQYQVELGDTGNMDYKIWYMKRAIDQMEDYQSGILDVSFTIWTDKAGFNPF